MTESKKSTREKAAAARAAAESEQRRRDQRVRLIGGGAIVVVVALIIGLGVWGAKQNSAGSAGSTGVVADAAVPKGIVTSGDNVWGIPFNKAPGKPTLAIWEDFGCPACAALEARMGSDIVKLAEDGIVNLVWRPTTFIEKNFPGSPNPDSSTRAASAWGCAIDAGKTAEFHALVFQNQPATEGDGWTDDQLKQFGVQAGISGEAKTTFDQCVTDQTYKQWTVNSYTVFRDSAIPGTPALFLNGKEVPNAAYATIDALKKYISENA